MPFTAKQRAYFHAAAARHEKGMKKLAGEADQLVAAGEELPPVKKKEDDEHEPWSSMRATK